MSAASIGRPVEARGGRPYRISAEVFSRMIACGAIPDADRVELWEGQLVEKMGKNPPHSAALKKLNAALVRLVPEGWHVSPECPLRLDPMSVPEPDLMVVRGAPDDYLDRDPTADDVALVIEVADSSLRKDVGRMLAAYAAAGVREYWVVNLRAGRIEAHGDPSGPAPEPGYRRVHHHEIGGRIPVTLGDRLIGELAVADLLPARP